MDVGPRGSENIASIHTQLKSPQMGRPEHAKTRPIKITPSRLHSQLWRFTPFRFQFPADMSSLISSK